MTNNALLTGFLFRQIFIVVFFASNDISTGPSRPTTKPQKYSFLVFLEFREYKIIWMASFMPAQSGGK